MLVGGTQAFMESRPERWDDLERDCLDGYADGLREAGWEGRDEILLGYVYVGVIVVLAIFFITGYYNLTAVELVAAVLIFSWVIVFLRNTGAVATSTDESTFPAPDQSDVEHSVGVGNPTP